MSTLPLQQIIEGAILAADGPLSIDHMIGLFVEEQPTRAELQQVLDDISDSCIDRGFELKKVAGGYRFQIRLEYGEWISRLWDEKP
ncbi:MAG: SMC-Scp complex subunit ScpB, partial [Gammaproteobacteria bacterium]|nr:SMC-Scp complex subunit ScpB [Gammaproteobacteria bacterium]